MKLILWFPVIIAVGGVAYLSYFIWSLNHLPKKSTGKLERASVRDDTDVISKGMVDDFAFVPYADFGNFFVGAKQNSMSTPAIKIVKRELIIVNSGQDLWDELNNENFQFFQLAKYEEPILIGNQFEVN